MNNEDAKQTAILAYLKANQNLPTLDEDEEQEEYDASTHDASRFDSVEGEDLLVLTDEEATERMNDAKDQYLDDVIFPELPEVAQKYFDREMWMDDQDEDIDFWLGSSNGNHFETRTSPTIYVVPVS